MPNKVQLTYEEVMKESGYDDHNEFRNVLKRNNLPVIGQRKLVDPEIAEQIVYRLQKREIDWLPYVQSYNDEQSGGVLEFSTSQHIVSTVKGWYDKLDVDTQAIHSLKECVIGIVSTGGFLQDHEQTPLLINLAHPINVIIGDRGSGKSTTLNSIGLLTNTVLQNTEIFITKLLKGVQEDSYEEYVTFNRRIYDTLKSYDVETYACFFKHKGQIYCFYAEIGERIFSILQRQKKSWTPVKQMKQFAGYPMLFLSQGEVTKIGEGDGNYYINELLDVLYPELHDLRRAMLNVVNDIVGHYEHNRKFDKMRIHAPNLNNFIFYKQIEVNRMKQDLEFGQISNETMEQLFDYIDRIDRIGYFELDNDKPIYELMDIDRNNPTVFDNRFDIYHFLFVGRITGYLRNFLYQLGEIESASDRARNLDTEEQGRDLSEILDSVREFYDNPDYDPFAEAFDEQGVDLETENAPDVSMITRMSSVLPEMSEEDRLRRIRRILAEEELETFSEIIKFLQTRLNVLRIWKSTYLLARIRPTKNFSALAQKYAKLLRIKKELFEKQNKFAMEMAEDLNAKQLPVQIYTRDASKIASELENEAEAVLNLPDLYRLLYNITPNSYRDRKSLGDLRTRYDETIDNMLHTIESLVADKADFKRKFVDAPIDVELRQGSTFRNFQKLSFGQRSGIILKIVTDYTNKKILMFDQPEDNLDASSVVSMLIPTLESLEKKKQVILVTHNANLVMGLSNAHIIAMESTGDYGTIRSAGTLFDPNVVSASLDILEGGIDTLEKKLHLYQEFVKQAQNVIRTMDDVMIESTYRQITLDQLRNMLQPILSNTEWLDTARHELKNQLPALERIASQMSNTFKPEHNLPPDFVETYPDFIRQIEDVLNTLHENISIMGETIEDVRVLNLEPKTEAIDLYDLLLQIRQQIIDSGRDPIIEIDPNIEGVLVNGDRRHLKLVFQNIFGNSLRATMEAWYDEKIEDEILTVELEDVNATQVHVRVIDNGCGMPPEVKDKLYFSRVSTQDGKDHGKGGIIIRKLLEINKGYVRVLDSEQDTPNNGTQQRVILQLAQPS